LTLKSIDLETLRITHRKREQLRTCPEARDTILDQLLEGIQTRLSRLENTSHDHSLRENHSHAFDITYGCTSEDVRNQHDSVNTYIKVKDARDMIPEIDGTSRNQVQNFLNASAMSEINPADERSLLRAILCTKLTGKAMYDFQTRNIRSFAQLKQEIEMCYLSKRGTSHIQREFNTIRQKPGQSAREYGLRLDKLAMELYQAMTEGKEHSLEQRKAILDTIQELALENFQPGLRDDIQTIV